METEQNDQPRAKGVYLLPNLLTLTALFSGFYAIIAAMKGHFDNAAIAIFVAMVMDMLDGRIARLTQTQTAFGAELDSLSDMVCFGVAPALIVYSWGLNQLGKAGWLVAFVYTAAVALRLARFNTQTSTSKYFKGLPCPAGASLLVSLLWSIHQYELTGTSIQIIVCIASVSVSLLMVSNLPYYSFKDFDFRNKVPFVVVLLIVLLFVLVSVDPPLIWLFISLGFVGSAPVWWMLKRPHLWRFGRRKQKEEP